MDVKHFVESIPPLFRTKMEVLRNYESQLSSGPPPEGERRFIFCVDRRTEQVIDDERYLDYLPSHRSLDSLIEFLQELRQLPEETIDLFNLATETRAYEGMIDDMMGLGPRREKKSRLPKPGYVYLISDGQGHTKIGRAKDWKKRTADLTQFGPFLQVILAFSTEDAVQTERDLHIRYALKHLSGEWFELDEKDIQDIDDTYVSTIVERSSV
jgi:hypothetical protein